MPKGLGLKASSVNLVAEDTDLSFIKNIIVGGNKVGIEFEREFNEWLHRHDCGVTISKGGGMAEYSACLFFTPFSETRKPGVYGHNVFPSEISAIINEHYAVKDCLVTGIADAETGSGVWPTAFIELKEEYRPRGKKVMREIRKLCEEKLPVRDRPRECDYIAVRKIVMTMEGKTDINATIRAENRLGGYKKGLQLIIN